jgi:hypothetical protein
VAQVPDRRLAGLLTGDAAEAFAGHAIRLRGVRCWPPAEHYQPLA